MKPKLTISLSVAWAITGLSALMIGAGILLWALAIVGAGKPVGLPSHQLTTPISGAVFAALGGLVLSRHPRHPIAWMLIALGVVAGVETLNLGILVYMSLNAPDEIIPAPDLAHWLAQWIWSPRAFVPLTLLLLLFPDGELPSRGWRPVAWAAVLSLLVSLAATGVIAVLFQPMRDRLERDVNRLPYGDRDQPYDVLSRLGRRLEGPAVPEAMLASIVITISQALKLPYVAIALPDAQGFKIVSEIGRPAPDQIRLPLEYKGGHLGHLICASRAPNEAFTTAEKELLRDIAVQAAVAVHASQLNEELQRSRERLVSAREEERRRLRRDLHDGLGPHLASLGFKLDAVRNLLKADPEAADEMLRLLRRQVKEAVGDIRRLTDDLRPPVLDELGLLPALRSTTGAQFSKGRLRIHVEGPDEVPPLPAAAEVAAYRIVQEAITNVARHANAESCSIRLRVGEGLELEILDDGIGLPESLESGAGLESMRERTAELGGRFSIEGLPERGTKVVAQIPLAPK